MIEKIVLDYLTSALSVPVYMQEPVNRRPDDANSFVVIEKTGSGKENRISSATIAIQSYAPTLYEAACLNEEVKEAMENIITLDSVTDSNLDSDYEFIKVSTKQPRYQAVFNIVHY